MLKSKGRQANKFGRRIRSLISRAAIPESDMKSKKQGLLGDPYTLGRDGTMSLWLLVPGWDPSSIIHSDIYHGALISQC